MVRIWLQASKQANLHTYVINTVPLVWCSLAPKISFVFTHYFLQFPMLAVHEIRIYKNSLIRHRAIDYIGTVEKNP